MNWATQVEEEGYGIICALFEGAKLRSALDDLLESDVPRSRAGIRHLMRLPAVSEIACGKEMLAVAKSVLGSSATAFRATLFDKSPSSNWLVAWHQDTALPLREKRETEGWGPWSVKEGVIYAHAPAPALEKVIALRLHLDSSNADNGPLRVLPGTHNFGVMTDAEIHSLSEKIEPRECCAEVGSVVLMRPLVVHASSKAVSSTPRRVLHIEYAASLTPEQGLELAIA